MAPQPARACLVALAAALGSSPAVGTAACYGGGGGFAQADWPFCHEIKAGLLMYYGQSGNDMKLGLFAEAWTGGWSALALAGNGGMKGASQLVVRKASGQWVAEDRHSNNYATPAMDSLQDVTLLFAREESGSTSWGIKVPMVNCDLDDFPIRNVSQWIHWARGQTHDFIYHGQERGQFHVNLINGPAPVPDMTGATEVDIRMPSVPVVGHQSGTDARNPYICGIFDLEALMPNRSSNDKHHVVKFAPYLDPTSRPYVHHIILFACHRTTGFVHNGVTAPCEEMPDGCSEMKWAWAVGSEDLIMPAGVGMPIGEGSRFMALQMHYYNPQLVPNVVDSSGVRAFVASTPRPVDAAMFMTDGGVNPRQRDPLPIGNANLHISSLLIPSACTSAWTSDINVFAAIYHGHIVGKRFNTVVTRGNVLLGSLRHEPMYDFNHQSFEEPVLKTLSPGDEIIFQCSYDTSGRSIPTPFGDLTQQEMCWGAFIYYPRQAMNQGSFARTENMMNPLSYFQTACSNPSTDPAFQNESECVRQYATDIWAIQDASLAGQGIQPAVHLCNHGIPSGAYAMDKYAVAQNFPGLCPQCVWAQTAACTDADIKAHARTVFCPQTCSQYGLSMWPDTSRTQATEPTHHTHCNGGSQKFTPKVNVSLPDGSYCSNDELSAWDAARVAPTPSPGPSNPVSAATKWSAALAHGLVGVLALRLMK